jgi:hypothetical protein
MGFGLTLADGEYYSIVRHLQETNKFYDRPRVRDRPAYESPGQGVIGGSGRLVRGGPREEAVEDPTARQW